MMNLSPFLEKKFFEYVDERVSNKTITEYEFYDIDQSALVELSAIIQEKFECLFFNNQPSGRRKIFLISEKYFLEELLRIYAPRDIIDFYSGNGGATISIDEDEDTGVITLSISAWGNFLEVLNSFKTSRGVAV